MASVQQGEALEISKYPTEYRTTPHDRDWSDPDYDSITGENLDSGHTLHPEFNSCSKPPDHH